MKPNQLETIQSKMQNDDFGSKWVCTVDKVQEIKGQVQKYTLTEGYSKKSCNVASLEKLKAVSNERKNIF